MKSGSLGTQLSSQSRELVGKDGGVGFDPYGQFEIVIVDGEPFLAIAQMDLTAVQAFTEEPPQKRR